MEHYEGLGNMDEISLNLMVSMKQNLQHFPNLLLLVPFLSFTDNLPAIIKAWVRKWPDVPDGSRHGRCRLWMLLNIVVVFSLQMSLESDDKRARTRSKTVRGKCQLSLAWSPSLAAALSETVDIIVHQFSSVVHIPPYTLSFLVAFAPL